MWHLCVLLTPSELLGRPSQLNESTHLQLTEVGLPGVVHELEPVAFGEVAQVGDECRDEEDVPTQSPLLFLESFDSLCPANVL